MWNQIYEYARDWLTISREVQENKADIKDIKQEVREHSRRNSNSP
ncbi:MAG TPA: hypothetical protein VGP58_16295 [Pyrinomonadaceae bacterium]|jgi:cell division protein FtsL|nr:hypothetical protein [Pyrinomonadaceae bacterium]